MAKIDSNLFEIGYLDTLAQGSSPLHRLDPRAKVITTLVFISVVISFDKYEISALAPFALYPIILTSVGNLPADYLLKKVLLVSPFAVLMGIFNPLMDHAILLQIGAMEVSGGWVSFISIMVRFGLTVGAAFILVGATGFSGICMALEKLGVPRVFVVQLLFLYRYLFVLMDEGARMVRARSLRSFGSSGMEIKTFGSMVGHLLLRTLDRAQRIHIAMCCRGFDGRFPTNRPLAIGTKEIGFVLGWSTLFVLMRCYNIPMLTGLFLTEFFL